MAAARLGALPDPPQAATIQLPGGASLTGMVEMPRSVPEQCRANFNLMLQLGPVLGSLRCLIALFRFVGWLIDFVKVVPNPTAIGRKLGELPPIAAEVGKCVTAYSPLGVCPPIKDALKVVRDYLRCSIEAIESVALEKADLQVQLGEAQGNPELLETLQLAEANADRTGLQALRGSEPAFGLLQTMGGLLEMVGAGAIELPSIDELAGGEIGEAVQPLEDVVEALDLTIEALPC